MKAYERLLNYVKVMTPSDDESGGNPSSECQFDLARVLEKELLELGVEDACVSEYCYVYGHIPATAGHENDTPIGFIAHMDTVADHCEHTVSPRIIENYDGEELILGSGKKTDGSLSGVGDSENSASTVGAESETAEPVILSPKMFPHLKDLAGRTLITTDGTTILGADDKAGIAEIMTMIERLRDAGAEIPHGPISIGFTPDEEIGRGADKFDVMKFAARYAYTVDGGREGDLNFETFNGAAAKISFKGVDVHPGTAKDTMINASILAMEFNDMLPHDERPEHTENYEGFYHIVSMSGSVSSATLVYIIRDHDEEKFERRQAVVRDLAEEMNKKYGEGTVSVDIKLQYNNMAKIIEQNPESLERAKAAYKSLGIEPLVEPIRGGTDGSRLSYMGLPCPNLATGGYAFHGPYEHITVEGMDTIVDVLVEIARARQD